MAAPLQSGAEVENPYDLTISNALIKLRSMVPTQSQRILELAGQRSMLRASDVRSLGLNPQLLTKLHGEGKLNRLSRGLYALPDAEFNEHQSLAEVCQRVPRGVICLLSALRFHEIGTQQPQDVWIALPEGAHAPRIDYPPLRVVRLRGAAHTEGVKTVMANGASIRVFDVEKTITDCFKFRNKIGLDVALEALKEAWRQRSLAMGEIARYAEINRVAKVMQPYLEAVVS